MLKNKRIWVVGAAVAALTLVGGGIGIAGAAGGGDDDQPIAGAALEQASKVALGHTGGGRVTGTEVGDEESYYEVEVTLDDGSEVDVQLDESFNVVGSKNEGHEDASDDTGDHEESGDSGESDGPGDN